MNEIIIKVIRGMKKKYIQASNWPKKVPIEATTFKIFKYLGLKYLMARKDELPENDNYMNPENLSSFSRLPLYKKSRGDFIRIFTLWIDQYFEYFLVLY